MSILIKNGFIYDGSGQAPYRKDILIKKDRISNIGNFKELQAKKIIDAKGKIILPGFIDINSGIDHHLKILSDPYQKSFLEQGVTTAIGGNLGSSLAPLSGLSIETIRKWGSDELPKTNINWQSFKEFLNTIKNKGIGVNFGSLVGHSSIKRIITRNNPRDLTEKEIELSKQILKKAISQGALGLSSSFEYGFSSNTSKNEIKALISIIKEKNKIYATDLQYPEKDPIKSVKEIINTSKDIETEINHLQPLKTSTKEYSNITEKLQKILTNKKINFDCYPAKFIKLPIYRFLPDWLEKPVLSDMAHIVKSGKYDEEIIEHLKNYTKKEIKFINVPEEFKSLENKTIKELSKNEEGIQAETLLKIMKETNLKPVCIYYNVDQKILMKLMFSENSIISSNGTHFKLPEYKPFIEYLKLVKKNNVPLEKAIMKITSIPASKFHIKKRGKIKENYYADISIIKNSKIETVIVNGKISFNENKITKTINGSLIK